MTAGEPVEDRFFVEGKGVGLREVRAADVTPAYYQWMNDEEVTRYTETRYFPYTRERILEYVERMARDAHSVFLAIVRRVDGAHIGNIRLGSINWIHRTAEIALVIGEKSAWGQGHGTEAIALVSDYAFRRLNLRKLTAGIYATNVASVRAFEKAGFVVEGRRAQQFFDGGQYVDHVWLGLINGGREWR